MSSFKIERNWLGSAGESVSDATMSRLKITVGNQNVTAFRGESERPSENLEIPSYYLAEWIAENWWPLLWEPRKSDDVGDSRDFLARHSALTAQHGFALPRLMFVPFGEQVTVSAKARNVQFADVRFFNTGTATLSRRVVEGELRKFVAGVVERLEKSGIHDTSLQEEWELIEGTEEDEAKFCRLMGALGLSPYVPNDAIASLLEKADEMYGGDALMDLCLTSSPENFRVTMDLAEKATELTASVPAATLEPLASTPVPADHLTVPGYRRGINAARAVRSALGIKDTDPAGSQKLFDKLHIDTSRRSVAKDTELPSDESLPGVDAGEAENAPIVGAVATEDARPKIALLQKGAPQRRFTAARGAFLAWTSDKRGSTSRLMTTAVTRDQQASRAFAAEIMVPISYLRKYSKKSRLCSEDIFEIAANLGASPDLVRKQAQNNGIEPSY